VVIVSLREAEHRERERERERERKTEMGERQKYILAASHKWEHKVCL
jgi:hypothetical protein